MKWPNNTFKCGGGWAAEARMAPLSPNNPHENKKKEAASKMFNYRQRLHDCVGWKNPVILMEENSGISPSLFLLLFSCVRLLDLKCARLPWPSLSLWACSDSRPLSRWCHPTISSSVTPFSSYLQSFPASGSFPMSWLFTACGQSIRASASASVLSGNIQGWFPLGLTGLISLLSNRLSSFL